MPATRTRRSTRVRGARVRAREAKKTGAIAVPVVVAEPKPVRGVKLRTVSLLTMLFSLLCLGAFLAGRPPLAAARLDAGSAETHPHAGLKTKRASAHGRANKRVKLATAATSYGTMIRGAS
jgi:hypothetical protein